MGLQRVKQNWETFTFKQVAFEFYIKLYRKQLDDFEQEHVIFIYLKRITYVDIKLKGKRVDCSNQLWYYKKNVVANIYKYWLQSSP